MIWDLALMGRVRRLYASGMLDMALLMRDDQALIEAAHKTRVAEKLIDSGHDLGVDINMVDVQFTDLDYPMTGQKDYIAKWAPMHGRVHLVSGPRDGDTLEVEPNLVDFASPLYFVMPTARSDVFNPEPEDYPAVPMAKLQYRLSGYHEKLGAWIYRYYL